MSWSGNWNFSQSVQSSLGHGERCHIRRVRRVHGVRPAVTRNCVASTAPCFVTCRISASGDMIGIVALIWPEPLLIGKLMSTPARNRPTMAIGRREGRRQLGNGVDKYVQVVAVRHDHGDRPGKAHDQRALKDILGAVQEHFAGLRKIMAGEHTRRRRSSQGKGRSSPQYPS